MEFFCATTAKQAFIFAGSTIFYLKYTVRSGKRALSDRSGRVCLYCCATKDSPMLWLLDNCWFCLPCFRIWLTMSNAHTTSSLAIQEVHSDNLLKLAAAYWGRMTLICTYAPLSEVTHQGDNTCPQNIIPVHPCLSSDLLSLPEESLLSAAVSPGLAGFCCRHRH